MNKKQHTIQIISASNENFAPHLATMFLSVLQSKKKETEVQFYVIEDNLSEVTKRLLDLTVQGKTASPIKYLQVKEEQFYGMVESYRIPKSAYHRIVIPDLIQDPHVKRMLYLDCDMIVLEDLSYLWDLNLEDKLLAAVEDAGFHERLEKMEIDYISPNYFNSGMMLIDLEKWRSECISEKVMNFANENKDKLKFHDQDALNAILHDRWLELHPRWNAQTYLMLKEKKPSTLEGRRLYKEARKQPNIVHFCGHEKPWMGVSKHPLASYYHYLRKQTQFPPAFTTINQVEGYHE